MPVFPVDATPKFLTGVNSAAYILKNSGTQTVYIGQDSSLTIASRAFSLTPGSVMQWPGKSSQIWAMTDPGVESEVEILYDSEASYTPGPDRVTSFNGWQRLEGSPSFSRSLAPLGRDTWPLSSDPNAVYDTSGFTTINVTVFRTSALLAISPVYVKLRWIGSGLVDTYRMSINGRVRIRTSVKSASLQIDIENGRSNPPTTNDFVYLAPSIWGSATPATDYYRHSYFFPSDNDRVINLTGVGILQQEQWESGFSQFNFTGVNGLAGYYYYDSVAGNTELAVLQQIARQLRFQSIPVTETLLDTNPSVPAGTMTSVDAVASVVSNSRFITPPTPMRIFVRSEAALAQFQIAMTTER